MISLTGPDGQAGVSSMFRHLFSALVEYVESAANWADELSRKGTQGNWVPSNAFSGEERGAVVELLHFQALLRLGFLSM